MVDEMRDFERREGMDERERFIAYDFEEYYGTTERREVSQD